MKPKVRRSIPRPLIDKDRARIVREARQWAASGSFLALRTHAFVMLALSGALRTKELLALDLVQVIEPTNRGRGFNVRSMGHLTPRQSKGRRVGKHQWDSAGMFVISKAAREALRAYIRAAFEREWFAWPPRRGQALFIANKAAGGRHPRIDRRTAMYAWEKLQRRAGLVRKHQRYGLHCLRHEAVTQFAHASRNAYAVAAYGRFSTTTALRYVHANPIEIAAVAESVN